MAACLLVVMVTSLIAAVSGLSMALGAFIAGILLSETEYRRAVDVTIQPFKGLLLGVFFVSVGMSLDLFRFLEAPLLILSLAATVVIVKGMTIVAAWTPLRPQSAEAAEKRASPGSRRRVRPGDHRRRDGCRARARRDRPEPPARHDPHDGHHPASRPSRPPPRPRLEERQPLDPIATVAPPADEVGRVIIAGYGRVGQLVGEMLDRHEVPLSCHRHGPGPGRGGAHGPASRSISATGPTLSSCAPAASTGRWPW